MSGRLVGGRVAAAGGRPGDIIRIECARSEFVWSRQMSEAHSNHLSCLLEFYLIGFSSLSPRISQILLFWETVDAHPYEEIVKWCHLVTKRVSASDMKS